MRFDRPEDRPFTEAVSRTGAFRLGPTASDSFPAGPFNRLACNGTLLSPRVHDGSCDFRGACSAAISDPGYEGGSAGGGGACSSASALTPNRGLPTPGLPGPRGCRSRVSSGVRQDWLPPASLASALFLGLGYSTGPVACSIAEGMLVMSVVVLAVVAEAMPAVPRTTPCPSV